MLYKYLKSKYWLGPITLITSLWLINILIGLLTFTPSTELEKSEAQNAFIVPMMLGVCWWGIRVVRSYSQHTLSKVITHNHAHHQARLSILLRQLLERKTSKALPVLVILSMPIVGFYSYVNGAFDGLSLLDNRLALVLQAWSMWSVFFVLMYTVFLGQRIISLHVRKKIRIKLFEIEQFSPFCQLILANFFLPCFIITLVAATAVLNPYSDIDLIVTSVTLTVVFCFLSYPIVSIRQTLGRRRELMLERLNEALNIQMEPDNINNKRRLVDDFERLQFVADLLAVRKEINNISLWPMDMPFAYKMAILALVPIFSWIGAGIVSQLLKQVGSI